MADTQKFTVASTVSGKYWIPCHSGSVSSAECCFFMNTSGVGLGENLHQNKTFIHFTEQVYKVRKSRIVPGSVSLYIFLSDYIRGWLSSQYQDFSFDFVSLAPVDTFQLNLFFFCFFSFFFFLLSAYELGTSFSLL